MMIHRLAVHEEFRPARQNYVMPPHNEQWGVEQDFDRWLRESRYITDDPREADWDYLPIYWNRYYINNNWGGRTDELQSEVLRLVSHNRATFTICEYDVRDMQPQLDLCNMLVFTASRRAANGSVDIPLLCSPHPMSEGPRPVKKWLASFVGNLRAHSPRPEMAEVLVGRPDCCILDGQHGPGFFVNLLLSSYIALAPAGHGGQSFRFYEAMQLGIVPLLLGALDARPFKEWIDWERASLYLPDARALNGLLDAYEGREWELVHMGRLARDVYDRCLAYGRWCEFVIKELERE